MIVADASFVIALVHTTDQHHQAARALTRDVVSDGVLHPITLAEVLVGPARRGATDEVHARLGELGFRADVPDTGQPLRLAALRAETGLKLPDCCVLDIALVHGSPLATFDERLAATARERRIDVLPAS